MWAGTRWVGEYGREYTAIKWERDRTARPDLALDALKWTATTSTPSPPSRPAGRTRGSGRLTAAGLRHRRLRHRHLGTPLPRPSARTGQPWAAALSRRAIYLVTDHHGVPWIDDGLREGDQTVRAAMTHWFTDALTRAGESWVLLTGTVEQRLSLAIRTTDLLLQQAATFAAPLSPTSAPAPAAVERRDSR